MKFFLNKFSEIAIYSASGNIFNSALIINIGSNFYYLKAGLYEVAEKELTLESTFAQCT